MAKSRDEFPEPVKKRLASRAAERCSICRELTTEHHSDGYNAIKTGRAAHIHAASVNGPRYDKNQSEEERKSQDNGIWVCAKHADVIDKDLKAYTADELRRRKRDHEAWVANNDLVPPFPKIELTTLSGLSLPTRDPFTLGGDDAKRFKDHELTITAASRHELRDLLLEVQFPESLAGYKEAEVPVGVTVKVSENRMRLAATVNDGGSVSRTGTQPPTNLFTLELDRLPPGRTVRLLLRTIRARADEFLRARGAVLDQQSVFTYILGTFMYADTNHLFERRFVVQLEEGENREILAHPPVEVAEQQLMKVCLT